MLSCDFLPTDDIKENADKVQDACRHNEKVKHRMHIAVTAFSADDVQNRADGVCDAAARKIGKAVPRYGFDERSYRENDAPAEGDIADHGEALVFFQIDRVEGNAQRGHAPDHAEQHPSDGGIHAAYRGKGDRRIGSGDQNKDGAVVENLKDLFRASGQKSVINARHRIQKNDRNAVYDRPRKAVRVAADCRKDDAQHQKRNPQCASDNVRYHVKNFLSLCVGGQNTFAELCSFHGKTPYQARSNSRSIHCRAISNVSSLKGI